VLLLLLIVIIQLMTFDKVDTMMYHPRRSDNDQAKGRGDYRSLCW